MTDLEDESKREIARGIDRQNRLDQQEWSDEIREIEDRRQKEALRRRTEEYEILLRTPLDDRS